MRVPRPFQLMSILKFFQRKSSPGDGASGSGADADAGDSRFAGPPSKPNTSDAAIIAQRRNERNERRELLYSVVREAMVRAGVLSSAYKFKVLSLDQRGRQFMIMMDLSREMGADPRRFGDIEILIAQSAKTKYDILVTAVYWRTSDHSASSLPGKIPAPPTRTQRPQAEPTTADVRPAAMADLRPVTTAQAAGVAPAAATAAATAGKSTGFEDTEIIERDAPPSGLGGLSNTQYGDLR